MFAQPIRYLTLDNEWSDSFTVFDPSTGAVLDLTAMSAKMTFTRCWPCSDDYGSNIAQSAVIASTATGEIVNGGTNGTLTVSLVLQHGTYRVRGDYTVGIVSTPFLNGQLSIGRDGSAQMAINIIPGVGLLWNDGGILAVTGDIASLSTTLPALPGILWNNGGALSIS